MSMRPEIQISLDFYPPPLDRLPMASSSAPAADLSRAEMPARMRQKEPPIKYLVPLLYAPMLPLIRITLRTKPVLRDRLFYGVLAAAFAHGTYIVTDLYDAESKSFD